MRIPIILDKTLYTKDVYDTIVFMPTDLTKKLVDELRTWYKAHDTRQKDLANVLDLSPQSLNEILAGRNMPTAPQILAIQSFLNDKTMNPVRVDPPKIPQATSRDVSRPRTLSEAAATIETLQAQIAQLKAGSVPTAKTIPIIAPPAAKPKLYSTDISFAPDKSAPKMEANVPAIVRKTWPKTGVDTPFKITEFLKTAPFLDLLDYLADPTSSKLQRSLVYTAVKERRDLGDN